MGLLSQHFSSHQRHIIGRKWIQGDMSTKHLVTGIYRCRASISATLAFISSFSVSDFFFLSRLRTIIMGRGHMDRWIMDMNRTGTDLWLMTFMAFHEERILGGRTISEQTERIMEWGLQNLVCGNRLGWLADMIRSGESWGGFWVCVVCVCEGHWERE